MKDELQEYEMDPSTRKTATDWLMQVIAGKRSNGHSNGSEHSEEIGSSEGGIAVAEMPGAEEFARQMTGARGILREQATPEITAEDLCGAPAVPIIKVPSKDEITADDVCWVPEELRLKPQPAVAELPSSSNLHFMPSPESREELDLRRQGGLHDPELALLTGAESAVTAADISREPAPYMVEPTWNAMDSGSEMREITAADIMRESVRNYIPEPSSSDMPTSFRVMRSAARPPMAEAAAPTIEAAAPVLEAAPVVQTAAPVPEPPVIEAVPVIEAAALPIPPITESYATMVGSAGPVVEAAAPVIFEGMAPLVEAAAPVAEAPAPVVEIPAAPVESSAPEAEIGDAKISSEEEDEADAHEIEEALEHPEDLSEQEFLSAPEPESAAAVQQKIEGDAGVKTGENIFAREGFWGSPEGNDAEKESFKAISREMKRAYTAGPDSDEFANHPEGWFSAWKTMLRLGSVLPWVARALPALESGALGVEPGALNPAGAPGATGVAQETRQDVAGLRLVQYEIRTTVQDHSMQLKRMEEQLTRVRESVDSRSSENAEVAENLRSMTKLVRMAGMGLGALLLVLIVLVIVMLAHR